MGLAELKIKVVSLACEIALISSDVRRYSRAARRARARVKFLNGEKLSNRLTWLAMGDTPVRTHALDSDSAKSFILTCNIDRLQRGPDPAKVGTAEQNAAHVIRNEHNAWSLHAHRVDLKFEFRHALLAYAFLRDRPYSRCECSNTRYHPNWGRVHRIAAKFRSNDDTRTQRAFDVDFATWQTEALKHLGAQEISEPVQARETARSSA